MENAEPYQLWLVMAAVAYAAFLFGRATARGGGGLSREERRTQQRHDAERVFSSLSASKQADADRLLNDGELIEAVKLIRAEAGIGLKEAKAAADLRREVLKGGGL